jgi:hypothetical protein
MRLCGKRLFTLVCKKTATAERRGFKNGAVRRLPGRIFLAMVEGRFCRGFWEKRMFFAWFFVVKLW